MTDVRKGYWVPRLRRLANKVIKSCKGCARFKAKSFATPPPGKLPTDRTKGSEAFEVIGVDFAEPLKYRKKTQEAKAYIVVYVCSLSRALYLEVLRSMETTEFLQSLKHLIARRGRPKKIYSDNGRTFIAAAKWVRTVMKDERLNDFLAKESIKWQFNLSRAPWWGGQFERLIGLIKQLLYKTIGNGFLSLEELRDIILDVEVTLNNRLLNYVEDDIQFPILTSNVLLFSWSNTLPELEPHRLESKDLRKHAKYLIRCKEAVRRQWVTEYLRGLRERHSLKHGGKTSSPTVGEVVIVKSELKNRGMWKLGIVEKLITGTDSVVRGAKIWVAGSQLERAVQHLYPLELACDVMETELNANAPEFVPVPRPRRQAAVKARDRITKIIANEGRG